ncbi:MAG: S1C family serine protease [Oscillospiraceae bacterium]
MSIEGLGFAIPINDVMRVVYDLQRYGRVLGRAYLGVTLQDLDSEVAATYNLPAGPQIVTVTEGSCAETAGLQPRDIILQFEDREISSFTDLSAALAKQKAGDTVTLKIYRAGAELEITLTLDERPGESEIDATEQQAQAEAGGPDRPRHRHPRLRRLRGLRLRLRYGLTQIQNAPPDKGPGAFCYLEISQKIATTAPL